MTDREYTAGERAGGILAGLLVLFTKGFLVLMMLVFGVGFFFAAL